MWRSASKESLTVMMAGALALAACGLPAPAMSADSCPGEFSAAVFQPLPVPTVVALALADSTPTNAALAGAFTRGMSAAGTQVAAAPASQSAATVSLRLTWRILGQAASNGQGDGNNPLVPLQPGPIGTGASIWAGNSQTFLQGGIDRAMPDMPQYDIFNPAPAQPELLMFRAEAHNAANGAIIWIGTVQCTLQGGDNQMLAYQVGQLIGSAIGQPRSRAAM